MHAFPAFITRPDNRIATTSQHTPGARGWVFDGADGTQIALWEATEDAETAEHVHPFDEWFIVIEGLYVVRRDGVETRLEPGDQCTVTAGTRVSGTVSTGTRTIHAFGGARATRAPSSTTAGRPLHNTFVETLVRRRARSRSKADLVNGALALIGHQARLVVPTDEMASVEARMNHFHLATGVLEYGVDGDFVEVGCNDGETSLLLQRLIQHHDPARTLHVFDSFEGAPAASGSDEGAYAAGDMATSKDTLVARFEEARLPLPEIHPGWFEQTLPGGLPVRIAFANVDGDLYESTRTALAHVYPRVVRGGVVVLGCYSDPTAYKPRTRTPGYLSPGVKKACDEFLADKVERVSVLYAGHYTMGYFRKK